MSPIYLFAGLVREAGVKFPDAMVRELQELRTRYRRLFCLLTKHE